MIPASKHRAALLAIHSAMISARSMAYEGRGHELGNVLDVMEYLAVLMLDTQDQTETFRGNLEDLLRFDPSFGESVRKFDTTEGPLPGAE